MTKDEIKNRLKAVAMHAVKQRIGNNKDHGWGVEDSLDVIDQLVAEDATIAAENGEKLDSYGLSEQASEQVKAMINPSQVRQAFEKAGMLNATEKAKTKSALKALAESLKS